MGDRGWVKSSHSVGNGACVEVAPGVLVRDSKRGEDSPVLRFGAVSWQAFVSTIKS